MLPASCWLCYYPNMGFGFFPAIFDHPEHLAFAEQEDDEKIELFLRQHGIVNLGWILISIIGVIAPVIFIQLDTTFRLNIFSAMPVSLEVSAIILWYLLLLAYVFEKFLYWYFNIYIVTNHHLVDVDFISLMYRKITEAQLADVQDVSASVSGVFGPLFNFGNVVIETAGQSQKLEFISIPKPDLVADRIEDLRSVFEGKGGV